VPTAENINFFTQNPPTVHGGCSSVWQISVLHKTQMQCHCLLNGWNPTFTVTNTAAQKNNRFILHW